TAQAAAIDAQDRILVAGDTFRANTDLAVARLRPGGALDGSFSGDGRVRVNLGADDRALDITVAPDGKIVVVGQRNTANGATWSLLRLGPGGGRDGSVARRWGRSWWSWSGTPRTARRGSCSVSAPEEAATARSVVTGSYSRTSAAGS